jgi:LysR family transcriptional regulator, regulator for bpeEF and oprC
MRRLFDLNDLTLFSQVVQEGSFAAAARKFGGSKATVSRRIAILEQELGAQLLVRTTRSLKPTEIGRDFYSRAQGILSASEDALNSVAKTKSEPSGLLRVTAGVEFGIEFLGPILNEYLALHPEVSGELDLTGRFVDLVYEGFDLGIRVGPLDDSTLSSRRLGSFRYGLFAAPSLLKRYTFKSPRQLTDVPALVFKRSDHSESWTLLKGHTEMTVDVQPRLISNNHWALRSAAVAGLGVVFSPTFIMKQEIATGRLKPVLEGWGSHEIPVHAVFPSQRFLSPKVRRFLDHFSLILLPK